MHSRQARSPETRDVLLQKAVILCRHPSVVAEELEAKKRGGEADLGRVEGEGGGMGKELGTED